MTIAISLKVNDGLVLAADSASTIVGYAGDGAPTNVVNVYNNANKIANLRKGLPIGAVTWGAGSIGPASISTLLKDFRRRISGDDHEREDWVINPANFTVREVAERLREFIYEELYVAVFGAMAPEAQPPLGFVVAGYSAGEGMADEFQVLIAEGQCPPPEEMRPHDDAGITWNGQPDSLTRLLLGFAPQLPGVLMENLGVPADQIDPVVAVLRANLEWQLVHSAMPIQDAVELAEFLVDTTIKVSRFAPGAATVGGEIEIAAITKHEGFKWVRRKHYFSSEFNPRENDVQL